MNGNNLVEPKVPSRKISDLFPFEPLSGSGEDNVFINHTGEAVRRSLPEGQFIYMDPGSGEILASVYITRRDTETQKPIYGVALHATLQGADDLSEGYWISESGGVIEVEDANAKEVPSKYLVKYIYDEEQEKYVDQEGNTISDETLVAIAYRIGLINDMEEAMKYIEAIENPNPSDILKLAYQDPAKFISLNNDRFNGRFNDVVELLSDERIETIAGGKFLKLDPKDEIKYFKQSANEWQSYSVGDLLEIRSDGSVILHGDEEYGVPVELEDMSYSVSNEVVRVFRHDERGNPCLYIGHNSDDLTSRLREEGYIQMGGFVPLSKGERFSNEELQELWRELNADSANNAINTISIEM